ncbi:MAG: uncharacterized protein K0S74_1344 [Chlamydiales bacterium]|jgi:nucleoside-diphosphate-sugar epimerase|nr:uncharacterized protein [Chlamydiales bacterium]
MAQYLITGVAGFIAQRVAQMLLEEGHTVVGLDELNHAYDIRLKLWRLEQLKQYPNFSFYLINIADTHALSELIKIIVEQQKYRFDAIINLAARAGVRQSVITPWVYIETNVTGTQNLLELARIYQIPKFVLASTSSLYGSNNTVPFSEEADTSRPLSPYAASKKAAEALCYSYHHLNQIDVTILRYFTVYGPAGRPDMSPFRFTQLLHEEKSLTIYGDGSQQRDFTYIDDIAKGTIAGLKPLGYEIINLGSDQPIFLSDMIHILEKYVGKKAKLQYKDSHPADMPRTWANIEKAKKLLNWQPSVNIEEGLCRLNKWYVDQSAWAKNIELGN